MNNGGGYIDNMMSKSIGWIDQIFSFATRYSDILIYGVVAMMFAKLMKVNLKIGK
jgi:hypothetical protein